MRKRTDMCAERRRVNLCIQAIWSDASLSAWRNCTSLAIQNITKTCLYNFDPLKPHFYIVKLGFTGVYIIFLISAQNIDCGYSLEPPREAVLTSTHNLCYEEKYEKYQSFLSENFQFWEVKFSIYLNRRVFVMMRPANILTKLREYAG